MVIYVKAAYRKKSRRPARAPYLADHLAEIFHELAAIDPDCE